jgi:hypothetical protein
MYICKIPRKEMICLCGSKRRTMTCVLYKKLILQIKQWGYKCVFSNYTTNSHRGTAEEVFNFSYTINKTIIDAEGRDIILDVTVNDDRFILVNLSGSIEDKPGFFSTSKTKIGEFVNNNTNCNRRGF